MEIKNCEVCKHEFEKGYSSTPQVCMDCMDTIYSKLDPTIEKESNIVYAQYLAIRRENLFEVWRDFLKEGEHTESGHIDRWIQSIDNRFNRLMGYIPVGMEYEYIAQTGNLMRK